MKEERLGQKILKIIVRYLLFFMLISFLVTCVMSLFVTTLSAQTEMVLTAEHMNKAAKLTFINVILLSMLITVLDAIRRKLTTDRITQYIANAAKQIVQGNFHVRIAPIGKVGVEEHYNEIIDCFNQMAQELQGVETLRTDFISNVSHEMKTPLAVIQNYGTLLQMADLPEEKRMEYAKGVSDASRRLADMMTNILKLNRLENQKIFQETEEFDLGEQLCECLLQYESEWERKEIEIETEIAEHVMVKADKELLRLVWNNLFSNAFKFTEAGGRVTVCLLQEKDDAIVSVKDTGCGMSAEVGVHIFEKFYQGDTSHSIQGNGLGLALVKRVIDITHSEIALESTVGEGTTFTVKIRRI